VRAGKNTNQQQNNRFLDKSPTNKKGIGGFNEAKKQTGLSICTEVMDTKDVELIAKYSDIMQIGARNMQNFNLLKEVGKTKKPVLLKRGLSSTVKEMLMSAEYILSGGNYRGITGS